MDHQLDVDDAGNGPYRPLDNEQHEFRVLDLHSGTGEDVLKCCLRHVTLNAKISPSYKTISYSWGDNTSFASLVIDDLPLTVPATAVAALARMRLPTQVRTLWIDAICINQKDLDERGQQVTRMASIYRHSQGNLVYLGEDDPSLASAMESIHNLLADARRSTNDLWSFFDTVYVDGSPNYATTSFHDSTKLTYAALDCFYGRAWFRRFWVIQETLVAPCNRCFCGPHELELIAILRAAVWMLHKNNHWNEPMFNLDFNVFFDWWYKFCERQTSNAALFNSVLDALFFSKNFRTTDARDKIFALLGLLPEIISQDIKPDYRIPASELMPRATRKALLGSEDDNTIKGAFFTLCNMEEGCGTAGWPSWVPRWDRPTMYHPGPLPMLCSAGGERPLAIDKQEPDENILSLGGLLAGSVCRVSTVLEMDAVEDPEYLYRWLQDAQEFAQQGGAAENGTRDLAFTLTAGCNNTWQPADEAHVDNFRDLMSFFEDEENDREDALPPDVLQRRQSGATKYNVSIRRACIRRVLFRTHEGRLGLGSPLTAEGDLVVVIIGCPWPLLLRPLHDGTFKVVAACYLHGAMHGEALFDDAECQAFRIR